MKLIIQKFAMVPVAACLLISPAQTLAFALLGPVQPWMQFTNGVVGPGDIGGPMEIGSGYRWNVPVITYGFDKSFLDYFGSNGVAAVQSAIQIINDLPAVSSLVLTNYPLLTLNNNATANAQNISDLKSQTLALLLEQLGLAHPSRNIFVMKQWNPFFSPAVYDSYYGLSPNSVLEEPMWLNWFIPDFIAMRNYDPQTLTNSQYVNNTLYTAYIYSANTLNEVVVNPADQLANVNSAVAENSLNLGDYYTGLTYDDVGGLCYLLSTNTVQYETLLPSVNGVGANSNTIVKGAWRPGLDKITFVAQPVNVVSGAFLAMTNQFNDTYITNGNVIKQQVQRVVASPDFLFSVADTGKNDVFTPFFWRTGTTNWINNASANGNISGEGPGVIQPPVQIVFNKLGPICTSLGSQSEQPNIANAVYPWGTYDGSTHGPIIYPITQTGTNSMTVRMWLERGRYPTWSTISFEWNPTTAIGTQFRFQTSTNLQTWVNSFTVTNIGSICTYFDNNPTSPNQFYRLIQLAQ